MKITIESNIRDLMTTNLIVSYPKMIMTEVSKIFETNSFHHLPVIDKEGICVGVISKSDYYQLQDSFTKLNIDYATKSNRQYFRSLLAKEVMTKPVSINVNESLAKVINIFLENRVHSVVVIENEKCIGIITPYDILKQIKVPAFN